MFIFILRLPIAHAQSDTMLRSKDVCIYS